MEFNRGLLKVSCIRSSKYLTISLSYTLSIYYWSFVYSWLRSWISLCTWLGFACDFLKVIHIAYQSSTACGSNIQTFKAHWLPMTWLEDLLWTHHPWVRSSSEPVPREQVYSNTTTFCGHTTDDTWADFIVLAQRCRRGTYPSLSGG